MNAATETLTVETATQALIDTFSPRLQALFSYRGQIVALTMGRPAKVRKGQEAIYKFSKFTCRCGVDYSNQKDVIAKRLDGTLPSTPQPRQWGEWVVFPILAHHSGSYYFRFSTVKNENSVREVHWMRNGKEITREDAQEACLSSEFGPERDLDCFDVREEHILEINGKGV
jgi:hypothetical protein